MDGVTLTIENYVHWLPAFGKSPCVVTPWNPIASLDETKTFRYFSLPIASRRPYRYGYPKADPFIWRRLRKTPFKIVHSHCPFSSGRLGLYAAHHHRVPMIATFHSKYRDDLKHSFNTLPWMTDYIMGRILEFFKACDHVWIPQASVAETVREYGYKGHLDVVENGNDFADIISGSVADYKAAAKKRLGRNPAELSLLFIGQHILEKGTMMIIEALSALKDMPFNMQFVGTGYAADDLKRRTAELGLSDRVVFNGIITDREVISDYYAAADLFLFPSPYDNAPLVIREAAAMGTPAILLKGSTASEVIRDKVNGFLIDNSATDMAALLHTLEKQRAQIADIGLGAKRDLVRSWQNVVEEVSDRYDDIVNTHLRHLSI